MTNQGSAQKFLSGGLKLTWIYMLCVILRVIQCIRNKILEGTGWFLKSNGLFGYFQPVWEEPWPTAPHFTKDSACTYLKGIRDVVCTSWSSSFTAIHLQIVSIIRYVVEFDM